MPSVSPLARQLVGDLMALPPEARNAWLASADPTDRAHVFAAVRDELGTPYGLWRDDPVGFVEIALGETLWGKQREVLRSLVDHTRTVVPSCHASGKSHGAARAVAWFIACHPPGSARVVTTSSKWRFVKNVLWPEIRRVHARNGLAGKCLQTAWQLELDAGMVEVAYGFSPDDHDETAFSGLHAPHILLVVDEAGALSPTLGQSAESVVSTSGGHVLAQGNPGIDETGTPWMELRTQSAHWNVISIPASSTPNFTGEQTALCSVHPELDPHPISDHLVSEDYVETIRDDEGEDSAYYIARVLAQFPRDVESKAIPISWLEDATQNDDPDDSTWVRLGVDVAADGGDRFSIARAEGFIARTVLSRRPPPGVSSFDLAGYVLEAIADAEELRAILRSPRRIRVKIDAIGIGRGVADTLKAWGDEGLHDAEIVAVNVAESCTHPHAQERFANQRAEMHWTLRELLMPQRSGRQAVRLEVDDSCIRQLGAPKYYRNSSGRIQIETKAVMKARGIRSPDDGEAVMLAYFEPGGSDDFELFSAADLLGR